VARENYSHQKYLKEMAKKKKAEQKKQRKLEKKASAAAPEPEMSEAVLEIKAE
jgi:hypothetical protein